MTHQQLECGGPKLHRLAHVLARILGGTPQVVNGVIVVQRLRKINVKIEGRKSNSPLTLIFAASFEPTKDGDFLNLGESVLLTKEVNPLLSGLRRNGLTVTALHNHWLFTCPPIWYMHWQDRGDPIEFALRTARAARVLED